jgi:hypothetical protein
MPCISSGSFGPLGEEAKPTCAPEVGAVQPQAARSELASGLFSYPCCLALPKKLSILSTYTDILPKKLSILLS